MPAIAKYFSEKALLQAEDILKQKFKLDFQPIIFEDELFFTPLAPPPEQNLQQEPPFQQKGSEQ